MRIVLVLALFAFAADCEAQEITFRREVLPPPTTFAEMEQLKGPVSSGSCALPSVSLVVDSLKPIILSDSATLLVPGGWQALEQRPGDDEQDRTRLAGPADSRALIERERNGATGRHFLMYGNGEQPEGATCSIPRGQAGVIWTFYPPHPQDPSLRKYMALGSIITPAGRWYNVSLGAASATDQYQLASILTELMLLQSPVATAIH